MAIIKQKEGYYIQEYWLIWDRMQDVLLICPGHLLVVVAYSSLESPLLGIFFFYIFILVRLLLILGAGSK